MNRKKLTVSLSVVICFFSLFLLSACSSSNKIHNDYVYFRNGVDTVLIQQNETIIHPTNLLGILVFSKTLNPEQAAIFNLPNNVDVSTQSYQVALDGTINFPIIGSIKAAGLTISQLKLLIEQKLTDNVKNPLVVIRFLQFNVNVLGEVKLPGTLKFAVDRVTIIDALSAAGDLTDYGRREDITVIRETEGKKVYHTVDLRSKNIFKSPVFNLQPNDIVYVSPNRNKLKTLRADPEIQRKTTFVLSFVSILVSISTLVVTLVK